MNQDIQLPEGVDLNFFFQRQEAIRQANSELKKFADAQIPASARETAQGIEIMITRQSWGGASKSYIIIPWGGK